jgi:hypothetical protein
LDQRFILRTLGDQHAHEKLSPGPEGDFLQNGAGEVFPGSNDITRQIAEFYNERKRGKGADTSVIRSDI